VVERGAECLLAAVLVSDSREKVIWCSAFAWRFDGGRREGQSEGGHCRCSRLNIAGKMS
jgi:hypothetical protein